MRENFKELECAPLCGIFRPNSPYVARGKRYFATDLAQATTTESGEIARKVGHADCRNDF